MLVTFRTFSPITASSYLRCFWDLEAQHSAIILIKSNFLCLAISLLYAIKVSGFKVSGTIELKPSLYFLVHFENW